MDKIFTRVQNFGFLETDIGIGVVGYFGKSRSDVNDDRSLQ